MLHWRRENGDRIVFRPWSGEFITEYGRFRYSLYPSGREWVLRYTVGNGDAYGGGEIGRWENKPLMDQLQEAVERHLEIPSL
jgi:hypothetical protein